MKGEKNAARQKMCETPVNDLEHKMLEEKCAHSFLSGTSPCILPSDKNAKIIQRQQPQTISQNLLKKVCAREREMEQMNLCMKRDQKSHHHRATTSKSYKKMHSYEARGSEKTTT